MNTKILKLFFAMFLTSGMSLAHADYREVIYSVQGSNSVKVKVKEKTRFTLDGWKHVKKVKVKVNGSTVYKTKMKIEVNGIDRDPVAYENDYAIYAIGESINSMTVVNIDARDIFIDTIICDGIESTNEYRPQHGRYPAPYREPLWMTSQISSTTRRLSDFVSMEEAQTFLVPIRTQAGRCIGTLRGRGPYSIESSECLKVLIAQVDFAHEFIQQRLEVEATFDLAVELLSLRDGLEDILN